MNLRKLLLLAFTAYMSPAFAQLTVFKETLGNVGTTTSLVQHSLQNGFDNDAYAFSDGNAANPVDLRSSSASTGAYLQRDSAGASGGANVWFSSSGERGFSISGVRAAAFDTLELYFAYRKESASTNALFQIDWSADNGQSWDSVSIDTFLPNPSASTGWYYLGPVSLPEAASSNDLSLRWIKTSGSMRVDDISLSGVIGSPFINSSTSALSFSSYSDYLPSPWQSVILEAYAFETRDSIFIACQEPFSLALDTQNTSTALIVLPDSDYYSQTVWVKMEAAENRGIYEDTLLLFADGTDTLRINLSGNSAFAGEKRPVWECTSDTLNTAPEGFLYSAFSQGNNYGNTQFISSSVSSDSYYGASGGNNGALAVATGSFDSLTSAYIGWHLTPDNGKELHLLGITFGARSTSSGPQFWCLRSSADGFSSNLYDGNMEANSEWSLIQTGSNTASHRFSDSTYFRLYLFGGSGSASINIANFRIDDLELALAVWNEKNSANFQSSGSGSFHDSSSWKYNYYDSLYRNASLIPGSNTSIHIRQQDSLGLLISDTLYTLLLDGKLALAGKNLELKGPLSGEGEFIGDAEASLIFSSSGDSSILRMSQGTTKESNSLSRLEINSSNGYVNLADTVYIHDWVKLANGTLNSHLTLRLLQGESTAAHILPGGSGSISGAMCMQTMIPGQSAGWRSLFSPLDTVTLGQLGTQMELNLQNTASSGDNRNAFSWSESAATWNVVSQSGFSLHDQPVHLYIFNPDSSVIELCGHYDTSEVSFGQLGFTSGDAQEEGWHLIGNPYPSSLRWSEVQLPTGANGNYAVWSEADGNYRPWNGAVGSAGDLIPPFQGFWVKVNQSLNEDFMLKNAYRDSGYVNHFGKKGPLSMHLHLQVSNQYGQRDAIDLFTFSDSNSLLAGATKLYGAESAPQLWLESQGSAWSILPYQKEEKLPLGLKVASGGAYLFRVQGDLQNDIPWELYDQKKEKKYPLIPGQSFSLELEAGIHEGRFFLQKMLLSLEKEIHQTAPRISIQKKSIHIEAQNIAHVELHSLDGKMLHQLPGQAHANGTLFGPLPYVQGVYILRFRHGGSFYSQLIYLP